MLEKNYNPDNNFLQAKKEKHNIYYIVNLISLTQPIY